MERIESERANRGKLRINCEYSFIRVHTKDAESRKTPLNCMNLKWRRKHCDCNCDATHCTIMNVINAAVIFVFNKFCPSSTAQLHNFEFG